MKRFYGFFLTLICFFGFSQTSDTKGDVDYQHYNEKHKINYEVELREDKLHLRFKTSDRPAITKILRTGLTVYFDLNGKKKRSIYFKYPLGSNLSIAELRAGRDADERPVFNPELMITQISPEAEFSHSKKKRIVYPSASDSEIMSFLKSDSSKNLSYSLIIPVSEISENGIQSLSSLSIGLVSGKFEVPQSGGQRPGGRAGGARPGGAGGGRPGGQGGGNMLTMTTAINFWFKPEF